jgi:hypothetical protein
LTIINYIPLIVIITKSMAGQLLTSGYSIVALAFAYLSLCLVITRSGDAERRINTYGIR